MIIYCHDFESFMNVIFDCTARGLTFEAYTDKLQVRLSGRH